MKKLSCVFLSFALLIVIISSAISPAVSSQNNTNITSYGTITYSKPPPTPSPTPTPTPTPTPIPTPTLQPTPTPTPLPTGEYVGFRSNAESTPEYWLSVATRYSEMFYGAAPCGQWILPESKSVYFDQATDDALTYFDNHGVLIYLQPGEDVKGTGDPYQYSIDYLIDATLTNYGHHSCVIGIGFDLEMRGANWSEYVYTSNAEAQSWEQHVKAYNSNFKLFLKHWDPVVMPPSYRGDIVFISDGQDFSSLNAMVSNFVSWGNSFSNAEVGFGVGYDADWNSWMHYLSNPAYDVTNAIFQNVPNAKWVYWVNFSIHEVFP